MVGKRDTLNDDQIFFSMPDITQHEQYQTFVFNGDTYKDIGTFDTKEELYDAVKNYAEGEVKMGTMTPEDAQNLIRKYQ